MKIDHFNAPSPGEWAGGGGEAVLLFFHRGLGGGWDEGMAEAGQASGQAGKPGAYP